MVAKWEKKGYDIKNNDLFGREIMKKILCLLLLILLAAMAGCGVEEAAETTAPLPIEVEVPYEELTAQLPYQGVELRMQTIWLREDPQARVLLQAAELFEKQTGVAVTICWLGEDASTLEDAQGTDIFQISAANFAAMPAEYVLDLTEMADKADYTAQSHETLRQQIVAQCGFLGAVAQVPYLGGIYYNTEIFEQCGIEQTPQTWDEFLALCEILRANGWQPLTLDKGDAVSATELHLRRTIGTEEITRLMSKSGCWSQDQAAIAALEQVAEFVRAGNMATGTPADEPAGQNKMALSNSAMMVGTNADCAAVEEDNLMELQWGIFPYPGSTGSGTWMTADMLVIHRDTKNAQAAFDFLMLLVTGEFDQLLADISDGIPADPSNASLITGAMDAIAAAQPEPLGLLGSKQQDAVVKLWSAWYQQASSYAAAFEQSK